MTDRVVLAYSGGLDTSVGIGWLQDATGKEVIALAVDVGQGGENMDDIRQRALDCGAVEAIVVDAKDEFANDFVMPALKANALYQKRYPPGVRSLTACHCQAPGPCGAGTGSRLGVTRLHRQRK